MNAVATPTRKVASKAASKASKAEGPAQVPAALVEKPRNEFTPESVKAAFQDIQTLLDQASNTEEVHEWSGDSYRLLHIAHDLADAAAVSHRAPAGDDIYRIAFDIAALIKASRLVPGEEESPARKAFINQAAAHLNWLTESDQCGQDCCDPEVPRPAAPVRDTSHTIEQVADSLPSGFNKHLVSNAWAHACEAREVVYACVMNYEGPEAIWGIHTILNIACAKLDEMVNDSMTEEGCEDASNLLAQTIALACMLTVTVNGQPWEMLLDAAISLMSLSKDHLDSGRGETCNA